MENHSADAVTAKLNEVYSRVPAMIDAAMARAQLASIDHETWDVLPITTLDNA